MIPIRVATWKNLSRLVCDPCRQHCLTLRLAYQDHATQVFNNHVREVQTYAKKLGREVLVYSVESGEGWKPLCDFLNVPVPTKYAIVTLGLRESGGKQ